MSSPHYKHCCECCKYSTNSAKDFKKHLATLKHAKNISTIHQYQYKEKEIQHAHVSSSSICKEHKCVCGKVYKHMSSLCKHKKTCSSASTCASTSASRINMNNDTNDARNDLHHDEDDDDKELIKLLIKDNLELKTLLIEQSKTMKELANKVGNNNVTNTSTKTFNLNFFLNETCKNAMNITDFINSIKPTLNDLEETGRIGYTEGITTIIVNNLRMLQQTERPFHCSDIKRQIIHIKSDGKWFKEIDEKPILKNAIKTIANANIRNILKWKEHNPECDDPNTRKNDKYLKIVGNSMSGSTEQEQKKNIDKIVSNIAKEILIEKVP